MADLINNLNINLSHVFNNIKKLTVSTVKFTVTLFTPDTHEHQLHQQVKLANQVLTLEKKPKVLGVTLGTKLPFTKHCNNIAAKMQRRNYVLKLLAGYTWSSDEETLLSGCSMLSYCCHVRLIMPSKTASLPLAQSQTGTTTICDRPDRRRSLIGRFMLSIQQYLAEEPLNDTSYKSAISSIHKDVVGTAIESSSSKLLNGRPPPIPTAEQTLPRKTRLAQQRTGHSRILGQ